MTPSEVRLRPCSEVPGQPYGKAAAPFLEELLGVCQSGASRHSYQRWLHQWASIPARAVTLTAAQATTHAGCRQGPRRLLLARRLHRWAAIGVVVAGMQKGAVASGNAG